MSASHPLRLALLLAKKVLRRLREQGIGEIPVVVGGIIPPEGAKELQAAGVARADAPKDFEIQDIMGGLADIVAAGYDAGGVAGSACRYGLRRASE